MAVNKNILTSPVTIDVSWEQKSSSKDTLDLTAFLLNESGQISEISDMVFYGTTEVVDMKLTSTKHHITIESKHNKAKNIASQCMTINLDLLPEEIKHIVFVVSNDSGKPLDKFKKAQIAFKDKQNNKDIIQIEDNGDNVFCVSVGDIQKKNELWTLIKESTCYTGGLDRAFEDFVPKSIRSSYRGIKDFRRPTISSERGLMPFHQHKEDSSENNSNSAVGDTTPINQNPGGKKNRRVVMPPTKKKNISSISKIEQELNENELNSTGTNNLADKTNKQPKAGDSHKNTRGVMPDTKKRKNKEETDEMLIPTKADTLQDSESQKSEPLQNIAKMANRFANKKNKK